ncbi:[protein-PII] uridylyltransferase [Granulibacter bethesdensis]|uniref:Bifunctional uridylyltransferase/uridylyl-removing enzyme n=1 Tax=Granulibacter bethesdensis (strain ATCC BAA-1260 / CGDNIH1) TaxID=391165 RepID=Q0BV39_GRABC|nr:[protein-PII] uridylyltransferase [Granulibacter bethesdensis]ABI61313.1 [protein-PII] uridylyltransferase [Granulibacter bethesdensis CGDNIH1]APH51100.1 [protein-PII] uridylyltransferase [Granulibacter bethesdensis]APH63794.1 [protein-PII] uridylyltransferase [Granulibacter bethesdensis]
MVTSSSPGLAQKAPRQTASELAALELDRALTALEEEFGPGPRKGPLSQLERNAALGVFRRHLARIQGRVRDTFEQGRLAGLTAAHLLSDLTDGLVAALYQYTDSIAIPASATQQTEPVTVAATGGYGRQELAPFSDIDLLFITADTPSARTLAVVEFMLYFLWDLGLKVGHATRSISQSLQAATEDTTVRTTLLDTRHLAGNQPLFDAFITAFREACTEAGEHDFIAAKQAERHARHLRYGESPFFVEPNIKEGRGGLRDLQTLYWLSRYVFGTRKLVDLVGTGAPGGGLITENEARLAKRSWNFLWTLRFHLHYVAGRAEERLTFDVQPVIGARMGYTRHGRQNGVERFMRHYFLTAREVLRLTRVLEPALIRAALGPPAIAAETDIALINAGFVLAEGKLLPAPSHDFEREPIQMLRIMKLARDRDLQIHPLGIRSLIRNERGAIALRDDQRAAALFLDLLCGNTVPDGVQRPTQRPSGARWMSILNETGFLGRFIPEWARIVGQMQFDTYHVFTVDEHTIEAIRVLNQLEHGDLADIAPVATGVVDHLQSRRALYVAMLTHDIAKGRGGDHSELGAELALEIGPALGLDSEETEMVSWLVLHHLLLSQTAFRRDIDDPKTILDLADTIQSPERLKLLLVLTVADMRAVSSKVWNGWKATLLRELYARVAEVLAGGLATTERDTRVARAKEAAAELLYDWPEEQREAFLTLGYPGYWLSFDPETHARHARMIRAAGTQLLTVDTQPLPARAVTEVTVYVADTPGLVGKIAGALAVAGASIVDARIHTMTNGMAMDTFWVQDTSGEAFDQPNRLAKIAVLIEQALSGQLDIDEEIRKASNPLLGTRMRAIHVPPRVVVDNHASHTHTVLEVNGRDRPGLMHDIAAAIAQQGLQIASAHITTYGVRAVDVFYVKDVFGLKVENERKLAKLRQALLGALTSPDDTGPMPLPPPMRRTHATGDDF